MQGILLDPDDTAVGAEDQTTIYPLELYARNLELLAESQQGRRHGMVEG